MANTLVVVPVVDILNILCDYELVFSVLDELYMFHIMLDAACNSVRVHYKV